MKSLIHFFGHGARQKFGQRRDHGFGGFSGRSGPGGRWGGRTRRGEGKYLVLESLTDGPQHGYEIMTAIETKRGFRPSPGSIYPTLQMLDEGGFVTSVEADGKRVYTITDAGRELLASHADVADIDDDADDVRDRTRASATKLMTALMSARSSDDATLEKIRTIIDGARREIYAILAADQT